VRTPDFLRSTGGQATSAGAGLEVDGEHTCWYDETTLLVVVTPALR
jgi:hypothetical protein